ncbi:MAG: NAD(P)H-dependent glycerol-3-phosphate dehydrogenase [Sporocytophaga sp.]|uniref:NAD(P)H-dependent glycerol-3-phosphate dehydrogenase n=1 Tax=Sporocytophaga sp. TaxID=2231183 RepID=UPI001B0B70BF|nr:NAD(P)H-dependent glycerol-3-phosphate dehydrogenase [Sporocytophaga sp.]MBO9702455.1 NAD(P)H-dependent glycerol-3-phosphate dehydrogenase [Sporocytophaga sp.]
MEKQLSVAVIGGGSWATALVKILSEQNILIHWWLRKEEDVEHILAYESNPRYASDIHINLTKVRPISDLKRAVELSSVLILAVPSAFIKEILLSLDKESYQNKIIVSGIKGMIPHENKLITDFLSSEFGVKPEKLCIIAGPCHSEEVAMEKKSYLTIAASDQETGKTIAELLSCRFVKSSVSLDLYGIEYAAIMKNIIAIACGITHGLNYGDNFQAVLVSNAMQEISRFVNALHPSGHRILCSSAFLGDLLVTTYSQFSRNRTFGNMIGRGYSVKSAQIEMNMVAEGYYAVKGINEINKELTIEMPIIKAVYNILYEKTSPVTEIKILESKLT